MLNQYEDEDRDLYEFITVRDQIMPAEGQGMEEGIGIL